jgi:hypothetical protein
MYPVKAFFHNRVHLVWSIELHVPYKLFDMKTTLHLLLIPNGSNSNELSFLAVIFVSDNFKAYRIVTITLKNFFYPYYTLLLIIILNELIQLKK